MPNWPESRTPKHIATVEGYAQAFQDGELVEVTNLCGRILRGKSASDFSTLTDDPTRSIVMLMGPDGLSILPGKTGYDMLTAIGYTPNYISQKISEQTQFKLVVFPESKLARVATWSNIINLISQTYPQAANALKNHRHQLSHTRFGDIEAQAEFSFAEVETNGPTDPRFMTLDRFLESPMSLADTRALLYFTVYLKDLFSGDGYTYDSYGQRGMQEYVTLNQPIHSLGSNVLLDISLD